MVDIIFYNHFCLKYTPLNCSMIFNMSLDHLWNYSNTTLVDVKIWNWYLYHRNLIRIAFWIKIFNVLVLETIKRKRLIHKQDKCICYINRKYKIRHTMFLFLSVYLYMWVYFRSIVGVPRQMYYSRWYNKHSFLSIKSHYWIRNLSFPAIPCS